MHFQSFEQLLDFCDYIENRTRLYALDFLGFPWYKMCKDYFNNFICEVRHTEFSDDQKLLRAEDFAQKKHLLDRKYDYVFFEKAKMRRKDEDNCENYLYFDLYEYLEKRNKSFIIFEEPSGKEYDAKYLNSKFVKKTIPFEFVANSYRLPLNISADYCRRYFLKSVEELYANWNPEAKWRTYVMRLKERYLELTGEIPNILYRQALIGKLGAKALIGSMGTHLSSGLKNSYAVVEVGHGFPGKLARRLVSAPPLERYEREHFHLQGFYKLLPSLMDELPIDDNFCMPENLFHYGMPELRAYLRRKPDLERIRARLNLNSEFVLLVATTGWIDYEGLKRFLSAFRRAYPKAKILLRPHPSYDNISQVTSPGIEMIIVETENKYDLFSIADAIISPPSSMVAEAQKFTDNIIIYPNRDMGSSQDIALLQIQYPGLKVLFINEISQIFTQLEYFMKKGVKKNPSNGMVDFEAELDRLFSRIENNKKVEPLEKELLVKGENLYKEGEIDDAQKIFGDILKINPHCYQAHNNLGVLLWAEGNFNEGWAHFKLAVEINPEDKDSAHNYMEARRMLG